MEHRSSEFSIPVEIYVWAGRLDKETTIRIYLQVAVFSGLALLLLSMQELLPAGFCAGYACCLITWIFFMPESLRRYYARLRRKPDRESVFGPMTVVLGEDNLSIFWADGHFGLLPWRCFKCVSRVRHGWVLRSSRLSFVWVPDQSLTPEGREFMESKIVGLPGR